jgi:excinuclease UvrABC nuclease subunit
MGKRKVNYNKTGIEKLPDDRPVLYRIKTEGGSDNYVGIAKRGRVRERLAEHLGEVPGATVTIEQFGSVADARMKEGNIIKKQQPKYNKQGK